jgi:hypothetical protein
MTNEQQYRKYNITVQILQRSDWYNVEYLCNGFTVTNIGDTIVKINEQIFYPGVPGVSLGDSRSYGGNESEIYKGVIKVAFQIPIGALPQIELVQKVYVE